MKKLLLLMLAAFSLVANAFEYPEGLPWDKSNMSKPGTVRRWGVYTWQDGDDKGDLKIYSSIAAGQMETYDKLVNTSRHETAPYLVGNKQEDLPYGIRFSNRRIYLREIETGKESVAFDFNLNAGDHFTTYNGMEWVVNDVRDTLLTTTSTFMEGSPAMELWISYKDTHKVMDVTSVDGKIHDRWIENVGSLSHFLLLDKVDTSVNSHVVFFGGNIFLFHFPFSADPMYGYGTDWAYPDEKNKDTRCIYDNGSLSLSCYKSMTVREYFFFKRNGDEISTIDFFFTTTSDSFVFPFSDLHINIAGLPYPSSGAYTLYYNSGSYNENKVATGVATGISAPTIQHPQWPRYDLQGRPISQPQPRQMYIEGGKKVVNGR